MNNYVHEVLQYVDKLSYDFSSWICHFILITLHAMCSPGLHSNYY